MQLNWTGDYRIRTSVLVVSIIEEEMSVNLDPFMDKQLI